MRIILVGVMLLVSGLCVTAQEPAAGVEKRVALSERAVAFDAQWSSSTRSDPEDHCSERR